MTRIEIGRLLRAATAGFVVGCRVSQIEAPSFGALVRVPLEGDYQVYGLLHDIHVDDDGLVRQLVTAEGIDPGGDRRQPPEPQRAAGDERAGGGLPAGRAHLAPAAAAPAAQPGCDLPVRAGSHPRSSPAPGALAISATSCAPSTCRWASCWRRTSSKLPRPTPRRATRQWVEQATQELITLLRDDYQTLMAVLGALGDVKLT